MSAGRLGFVLCLILLTACGAGEPRWASDAAVKRFAYRPNTVPELRLYTIVSTRNGSGAHSGLLISTNRERILFDPAGTFTLPQAPERNDVLYGISPQVLSVYIDYHARETYDVYEQRVAVTAAQAEQVAALAKAYGPVADGRCSLSINQILRQVSGFGQMRLTYFPNMTRDRFGALPGAETRLISDDDADANEVVLMRAARG